MVAFAGAMQPWDWSARRPPALSLLVLVLWELHFLRRTLESAFVHRYSEGLVGVFDMVRAACGGAALSLSLSTRRPWLRSSPR